MQIECEYINCSKVWTSAEWNCVKNRQSARTTTSNFSFELKSVLQINYSATILILLLFVCYTFYFDYE